jgi:hypothetical protein
VMAVERIQTVMTSAGELLAIGGARLTAHWLPPASSTSYASWSARSCSALAGHCSRTSTTGFPLGCCASGDSTPERPAHLWAVAVDESFR